MMDLLTANDKPGEYPNSYYAASADFLSPFPEAIGDLKADVCVIGGGFTGLSSALHLAERGYSVILLEAQRIGFGASGRNGGQVGRGQRVDQIELEAMLGLADARKLWTLAGQSVDLVKALAASDLIGVAFHEGLVHASHKKRFVPYYKAYAHKLNDMYGYDQISFIDREICRDLVGSEAFYGGTLDKGSGHIHPLNFALGLARSASATGARIFERSRVVGFEAGDPCIISTDQARIKASFVVMGCNGYLGRLDRHTAKRVMPINNYIVATEPLSKDERDSLIKHNYAVVDSKFVVNYFRFSEDNRLLFGGTESYGYRFPGGIAEKVRKPMLSIFPQLKDRRIDYAWGGTLGITMNRMPHFERLGGGGNVLTLSGFSGHGVAMATLAGQIAAETIAGQAERFDIMAHVPTHIFPGGVALRTPLLVLAMLWYRLRDSL